MLDLLKTILGQLNSSVFVLIFILIFVVLSTAKVANLIGQWKEKFTHQDKQIDKLEGLSERVIDLSTKINLIYQNTNPNRPVQSNSPISLTDIGREIKDNINALSIFNRYREKLIKEIESSNPKNAYDIQQMSMDFARTKMITFLNEEELLTVKNEAFNHGLLVEDIMSVFGVILRDQVLTEKNIPISEVDNHKKRK